ncbi:hypothetical protein N7470_009855 [Penicillium chermesinum]|nr:hypothetical protein N7470_009855 [Penicillium chermesinum]
MGLVNSAHGRPRPNASRFPLQIYTRRHARREQDLAPLTSAVRRSSTVIAQRLGLTKLESETRYKNRMHHINDKFNLNTSYRYYSLAQIPVFIALMDALRAMSGNRNGLIPWFLSLFEPEEPTKNVGKGMMEANPVHVANAPSLPLGGVPGSESASQDFLESSAQLSADTTAASPVASSVTETVYRAVDPTLATEGALWFPDLLAGDSTGILPFILTATIITNVTSGLRGPTAQEISRLPKLEMYRAFFFGPGLKSFFKVLAVTAGVTSYMNELPVALLLYWITSTNVATLQTKFLDKYMFKRPAMKSYVPKYVRYEKAGDPFGLKLK